MHNVDKWPKMIQKSFGVHTETFLKYAKICPSLACLELTKIWLMLLDLKTLKIKIFLEISGWGYKMKN